MGVSSSLSPTLPTILTTRRSPGLLDFFVAYGQNPDKKWPKSQNVLTMVISIFIGVSNCLDSSIFFAKKMWFCQRSKFLP